MRQRWRELVCVLADYPKLKNRAVVYCFTGGEREAEILKVFGLFMGVTAIIARLCMEATRQVIAAWPLERLFLETDGP